MELYDLIFLGMLGLFGLWGLLSGALRQILNLGTFILSMIVAAASRDYMARTFNLDDVTSYIAIMVLFAVLFVGLRLVAGAIVDGIHRQSALGTLDRLLGGIVGIVWTLLILGSFHLIFAAVTPIGSQPKWFTQAKAYALTAQCAKTIQALLPEGTKAADTVATDV